MNESFRIRELLTVPISDVWKVFNGSIKHYLVEYEDGVTLKVPYKHLILGRHTAEIFERYPLCPMTSRLTLTFVLKGEYYNSSTNKELDSAIFSAVCAAYNLVTFEEKKPLLYLITKVFNDIYNNVIQRLTAYSTTIDANDFVSVVTDSRIMEIHANMQPTPQSVEQTYKKISETLKSSSDYDNMFIHAYKSKAVNENQANQCIGPIGFSTDIERTVFRVPIMSGFIRGFSNIYELAVGSRTAAKALNANDNQIRVSEYISRRFQLLSMVVTSVEHGDCMSDEHIEFLVRRVDLDLLKGKYYLLPDGVSYGVINGTETHLEGTVIRYRSVLGCKHPDPHKVCSVCFGAMAGNFPANSNVGHLLTTYAMDKVTSALLATKHLASSVKDSKIDLMSPTSDFLHVDDSDKLFINKDIDERALTILIRPSDLPKLRDVVSLSHTNIATAKIGELSSIAIIYNKGRRPVTTVLALDYQDRRAVITHDFLCHIKRNKLETDSKGNYMVSMDGWPKASPVFMLPLKEDSPVKFANSIATIVEAGDAKVVSPLLRFELLYDLAAAKLKLNSVIIELLIYATTSYNSAKGDYSLGRNSATSKHTRQMGIFGGRSMSQLYSFEGQMREIYENNGRTFVPDNRIDHPLDLLFDPVNVLANK
jgi:hypothetical protein